MKTNVRKVSEPVFTHEGGKASKISKIKELERTVMSCLLWEDEFYEAFWEVACCGECQRMNITSWEDFYDRFSGEMPDYSVWEGTPTRR